MTEMDAATPDARAQLRARLDTLRSVYQDACRALEVFVRDSFKNVSEKAEKVDGLLTLLSSGVEVRSSEAEKFPKAEWIDENTIQLTVTREEREEIFNAVQRHRQMYDIHPQMVLDMALSHAFALFDALLADVLFAAFCAVPEQLRSRATLTYEEALRFPTREALIEELARRRVLDLMYGNLEKQLEYFSNAFRVDALGSDQEYLSRLQDLRDRRNLIVHNNGRASIEYADRHGLTPGEKLLSDPEVAEGDRGLLSDVGDAVASGVMKHFAPSANIDD